MKHLFIGISKKLVLICYAVIACFILVNVPIGSTELDESGNSESSPNYVSPSAPSPGSNFVEKSDYVSKYEKFSTIVNDQLNINKIYVIESALDLYNFSIKCSDPDVGINYLKQNYVLGNDIDYQDVVAQTHAFRPIGFLPNPNPDSNLSDVENGANNIQAFTGTFDGQGFEISNLYLEYINDSNINLVYRRSIEHFTIFSRIAGSGVVKNIGFINPIAIIASDFSGTLSHISYVSGENYGTISHVYVQDTRELSAGLTSNGQYHLSSFVSENYGTINDCYVSTPRVASLQVQGAVTVNAFAFSNEGSLIRTYYDSTLYTGANYSGLGTGLSSAQFLDHSFFSDSWFFYDSYSTLGFNLRNTYPILLGIPISGNTLQISTPAQFIYWGRMMSQEQYRFHEVDVKLIKDIDMKATNNKYKTPSLSFSGTFSGNNVYFHGENQANNTALFKRNKMYAAVVNLNIEATGYDYNTYALAGGIFNKLSGTVSTVVFADCSITYSDLSKYSTKSYLAGGFLAGLIEETGFLNQVHMYVDTRISDGNLLPKSYFGGVAGLTQSRGQITFVSHNGSIDYGLQQYQNSAIDSAFGGVIGKGEIGGVNSGTPMSHSFNYNYNKATVVGVRYSNTATTSRNFLGGLIGRIDAIGTQQITVGSCQNYGKVTSYASDGQVGTLFMGGIVGMIFNNESSYAYVDSHQNAADLDVFVNGPATIHVSGIYGYATLGGNISGSSIRNYGDIKTRTASNDRYNNGLSNAQLSSVSVYIAGLATYFDPRSISIWSSGNFGSIEADLSLVNAIAGLFIFNNTYDDAAETDVFKKYSLVGNTLSTAARPWSNYWLGKIDAYTGGDIYKEWIKIAGFHLGKNCGAYSDYLDAASRATTSINVDIRHNAPASSLQMSKSRDLAKRTERYIEVAGYAEHASGSITTSNISIDFKTSASKSVWFHVYLAGMNITSYSNMTGIIKFGNVTANAYSVGNLLVGGITCFSESGNGVTSSANYGEVSATLSKATPVGVANYYNYSVIAGGITAGGMTSTGVLGSANVYLNINYGNVTAINNTSGGVNYGGSAVAGGIVGTTFFKGQKWGIASDTNHSQYPYIYANVNFGNINSTSNSDYRLYANVYKDTAAGGIIGTGRLTYADVNYGNVSSNRSAGGIIGSYSSELFTRDYWNNQFYDIVNYGNISVSNGTHVGSIIGKVFLTPTSMNNDKGTGYVMNMRANLNIFGSFTVSSTINSTYAGYFKDRTATIKSGDNSFPFGQAKYYPLNNASGGIFNDSFFYKVNTNRYLKFLPTSEANTILMTKVGISPSLAGGGLYAISQSTAAAAKFLPDNIVVESTVASRLGYGTDVDAMLDGFYVNGETLRTILRYGARQTGLLKTATVTGLQVRTSNYDPNDNFYQTPSHNRGMYYLTTPQIDQDKKMITYYVTDNLTRKGDYNRYTIKTMYTYILASEYQESPDAYYVGGVWKGNYRFNGTQFVFAGSASGTHVRVLTKYYDVNDETYITYDVINSINFGETSTLQYYDKVNKLGYYVPPTIIPYVGPFDSDGQIYDVNGNSLVNDYFGTVRAYSEAYVHGVTGADTYTDYKIRIVRLNDMEIKDNYTRLQVSGASNNNLYSFSETTSGSGPHDVTISPAIPLTESSTNIYFNLYYNFKNYMGYSTADSGSSYYTYTRMTTYVYDENNNQIATWAARSSGWGNPGSGWAYDNNGGIDSPNASSTYIRITVNPNIIPGGNYRIVIIYGDDLTKANSTYTFRISKAKSDVVDISRIDVNTYSTTKGNDGNFYTEIPFGLSYSENDSTTSVLNFSNLLTIVNKYPADISSSTTRPSYTTNISFAHNHMKILSMTASVSMIDSYRHQYTITYRLQAESGRTKIIYHYITEKPLMGKSPTHAYKNDVLFTNNLTYQSFPRNESPVFKYEYDFTNLYMKEFEITMTYSGIGTPISGIDYDFKRIANGIRMEFLSNSPVGIYYVDLIYDRQYTFSGVNNPLNGQRVSWYYDFVSPEFHKVGSSDRHLQDLAFVSESFYTGLFTIIDTNELSISRYNHLVNNPADREIYITPTLGINYGNYKGGYYSYWIVGQVSKTNLLYYSPTFQLPAGAVIVRVQGDGTETSNLYDNFYPDENTPPNSFKFIHYRIYAENYIAGHPTYGKLVTDYYISVQDVSNNVSFDFTVIYGDSSINPFSKLFISMTCSQYDVHKHDTNMYAYFGLDEHNQREKTGTTLSMTSTTHGTYYVFVNLPDGYGVELYVNCALHGSESFGIGESVIPKHYSITIKIVKIPETGTEWGQTGTA